MRKLLFIMAFIPALALAEEGDKDTKMRVFVEAKVLSMSEPEMAMGGRGGMPATVLLDSTFPGTLSGRRRLKYSMIAGSPSLPSRSGSCRLKGAMMSLGGSNFGAQIVGRALQPIGAMTRMRGLIVVALGRRLRLTLANLWGSTFPM